MNFLGPTSLIVNDESGATAIEYGLIVALIGLMIVTALPAVGGDLRDTFGSLQEAISGPERCKVVGSNCDQ